ncbi:hypothetical protein Tco_0072042 [Tanacetum coccineum]
MQQFWHTIKKIQGTDSYEFLLANKKCIVNAEVFRTILDICPRVDGVDFTDVRDDDIALAFLIELGYKGPIYKHTNMFVDRMHQPWRTLAAIINKCLSGKTASNDKLRKSRIDILWGIYLRSFPQTTRVSLFNLTDLHYHTIKDDGILCKLKFVKIAEDYQEYRLGIPDTMLTEEIKRSESYQMFYKYSTGQIPLKKSRESEPKPKPVKKRTSSKKRVKKIATISAEDNIIPDPNVALELGKSISLTKDEEAKAVRKVHATHALKESRKSSRRQPGTRDLNEGTGSKPGVIDESIVTSATSSEGTGVKPGVPDEDKNITEEKNDDQDKDDDADDEGYAHTQDADDKDDETESDEDDI